jgi:lipopolysaccharide transport system ATP-binding protein
MSKLAIRIENVSKQYRIGGLQQTNRTLREALTDSFKMPFRRLKDTRPQFWALQDVSFDIHPGEVVGLIGRNGAGKSTLLKILSRITEPTHGSLTLYGRVGSLLEVGTGFHPELTGRENVFMNGAILGMKRREISRKFDEIVAFAEIEKFIDTPVKFYSSGMYLRLAFSVAAHLETEILLVDEVLAVGDMNFQRKSLNKMESVGREGRTVVLVSHNMGAISRLCSRAVLLDGGRLKADGDAPSVVNLYLSDGQETTGERTWEPAKAPSSDYVRLVAVRVLDQTSRVSDTFDIRQPITFEIEYDVLREGKRLSPYFTLYNEEGVPLFSSADLAPDFIYEQELTFTGRRISRCVIPAHLLAEGMFTMHVGLSAILDHNAAQFNVPDCMRFQVIDPMEGDSARGVYGGAMIGVMRPKLAWQHEPVAAADAAKF